MRPPTVVGHTPQPPCARPHRSVHPCRKGRVDALGLKVLLGKKERGVTVRSCLLVISGNGCYLYFMSDSRCRVEEVTLGRLRTIPVIKFCLLAGPFMIPES